MGANELPATTVDRPRRQTVWQRADLNRPSIIQWHRFGCRHPKQQCWPVLGVDGWLPFAGAGAVKAKATACVQSFPKGQTNFQEFTYGREENSIVLAGWTKNK